MRKLLYLFPIFVITIFLCSCSMQKASPIDDFLYEFENGEAIITGYIGTDLEIVIPSEIEGRPVTRIGYNSDEKKGAFEGYDMKSIIIPEGVEFINDYAFDDCLMLENISLPNTLKGFYHGTDPYNGSADSAVYALGDTKWFNNQPDGVLYIDNVLLGIKGDTYSSNSIEVKKGTTTILSEAFYGEDNITEVIIPNSVKYIGKYAFRNCDLLKEITVPDGVVVGNDAFGTILSVKGEYVFETQEE